MAYGDLLIYVERATLEPEPDAEKSAPTRSGSALRTSLICYDALVACARVGLPTTAIMGGAL
jgi:hypothetical protein